VVDQNSDSGLALHYAGKMQGLKRNHKSALVTVVVTVVEVTVKLLVLVSGEDSVGGDCELCR